MERRSIQSLGLKGSPRKRAFLVWAMPVALLGLTTISCGGDSSGTLGTNSYPGTWSGTITTVNPTTNATINQEAFSLVITSSGTVTGTDAITIPGITTNDTGTIDTSGDLSLATSRSGSTVQLGTITASLLVISNTLEGSGSLTIGTTSTPIQIALAQTSTATSKVKPSQPK